MLEMNFCTRSLPYIGSPGIFRRRTHPLRGICYFLPLLALLLCSLRPLGAVFRAPLLAIFDSGGVQRPTDHVVTDSRQILHPAAADEHDRVLLQVVADSGNIR